MLIRLSNMAPSDRRLCEKFIQWGVIAYLKGNDDIFLSTEQFALLQRLQGSAHVDPLQLFSSDHEFRLSDSTALFLSNEKRRDIPGSEILKQLLPRVIEPTISHNHSVALGRIALPGYGLDVQSRDLHVLQALENQVSRFVDASMQRDRTSTLARSASYMGAKTLLCPAISEVLQAYLPSDAVILDLMCGSGATAGALAQTWKVYASDAQSFSRYLSIVQGGGMTSARAKEIVKYVVELAKSNFANVYDIVGNDIDREEGFLMSELSESQKQEFVRWAVNYPRVNTERFAKDPRFAKEIELRRADAKVLPPVLFTRYYANLFFGVRQSAEIDSLRAAIDLLENEYDRKWAIGALVCAVSACADNYGGHFAQPRFDPSSPEKLLGKLKETVSRRTMSITQEFSARLISLALESERVLHSVDEIGGPWQTSLKQAKSLLDGRSVTVYLDPPYTRDEYSRYYHVLETLVRYDYPLVSGKASIPIKGREGRFASEFFTRNSFSVEETIAEVISTCLENQWSCLWSYSSSGIADIASVVERLAPSARHLDIYMAKYSYKPQGKRKVENKDFSNALAQEALPGFELAVPEKISGNTMAPVDEYMIMIRP